MQESQNNTQILDKGPLPSRNVEKIVNKISNLLDYGDKVDQQTIDEIIDEIPEYKKEYILIVITLMIVLVLCYFKWY